MIYETNNITVLIAHAKKKWLQKSDNNPSSNIRDMVIP